MKNYYTATVLRSRNKGKTMPVKPKPIIDADLLPFYEQLRGDPHYGPGVEKQQKGYKEDYFPLFDVLENKSIDEQGKLERVLPKVEAIQTEISNLEEQLGNYNAVKDVKLGIVSAIQDRIAFLSYHGDDNSSALKAALLQFEQNVNQLQIAARDEKGMAAARAAKDDKRLAYLETKEQENLRKIAAVKDKVTALFILLNTKYKNQEIHFAQIDSADFAEFYHLMQEGEGLLKIYAEADPKLSKLLELFKQNRITMQVREFDANETQKRLAVIPGLKPHLELPENFKEIQTLKKQQEKDLQRAQDDLHRCKLHEGYLRGAYKSLTNVLMYYQDKPELISNYQNNLRIRLREMRIVIDGLAKEIETEKGKKDSDAVKQKAMENRLASLLQLADEVEKKACLFSKLCIYPKIEAVFSNTVHDQSAELRLNRIYKAIEAIQYADNPQWVERLRAQGITDHLKIRNPVLDLATELKLALTKRAVSFCHASYLVLRQYIKSDGSAAGEQQKEYRISKIMEEIFKLTHAFTKQVLAHATLSDPDQLKKIIKNNLCHLISEMGVILNTNATPPKSSKQLLADITYAERLANWERRSGYAIVSVDEWQGLSNVWVEPALTGLTEDQEAELDAIDLKNPETWVARLNPLGKDWLLEHREAIKRGEFVSPPSVFGDIPMAANMTTHTHMLFKGDELALRLETIRRRTLTPYSIYTAPESPHVTNELEPGQKVALAERQRIANQNAVQVMQLANAPKVFASFWSEDVAKKLEVHGLKSLHVDQSLLTPLIYFNTHPWVTERFTHGEDNNLTMRNETAAAMNEPANMTAAGLGAGDVILTTNFPINAERDLEKWPRTEKFYEYRGNVVTKNTLERFYIQTCKGLSECGFTPFISQPMDPFAQDKHGNPVIDDSKLPAYILKLREKIADWAPKAFGAAGNYLEKANRFLLGLAALADHRQIWQNCQNYLGYYYQHKDNNIELFAATHILFMVNGLGGVVTNGCKSAKDRKGIELTQMSSMAQVFVETGELPKVHHAANTPQRKHFVKTFAEHYRVGHAPFIAGDNSFGCDGCLDGKGKLTPEIRVSPMIPNDCQVAIGKDRLKAHNVLGRQNKIKVDKDGVFKKYSAAGEKLDKRVQKRADAAKKSGKTAEPLEATDSKLSLEERAVLRARKLAQLCSAPQLVLPLDAHVAKLGLLQNLFLVEKLRNPARSGNYLKETLANELLLEFNRLIWQAVKPQLEIKESNRGEQVAVSVPATPLSAEAEFQKINDLLQQAGITLSHNAIKKIQTENGRLRAFYQELKQPELQAYISCEDAPILLDAGFNQEWARVANSLAETKELPADFNAADREIRTKILLRKIGQIDLKILNADQSNATPQVKKQYRAQIRHLKALINYLPVYLLALQRNGVDITNQNAVAKDLERHLFTKLDKSLVTIVNGAWQFFTANFADNNTQAIKCFRNLAGSVNAVYQQQIGQLRNHVLIANLNDPRNNSAVRLNFDPVTFNQLIWQEEKDEAAYITKVQTELAIILEQKPDDQLVKAIVVENQRLRVLVGKLKNKPLQEFLIRSFYPLPVQFDDAWVAAANALTTAHQLTITSCTELLRRLNITAAKEEIAKIQHANLLLALPVLGGNFASFDPTLIAHIIETVEPDLAKAMDDVIAQLPLLAKFRSDMRLWKFILGTYIEAIYTTLNAPNAAAFNIDNIGPVLAQLKQSLPLENLIWAWMRRYSESKQHDDAELALPLSSDQLRVAAAQANKEGYELQQKLNSTLTLGGRKASEWPCVTDQKPDALPKQPILLGRAPQVNELETFFSQLIAHKVQAIVAVGHIYYNSNAIDFSKLVTGPLENIYDYFSKNATFGEYSITSERSMPLENKEGCNLDTYKLTITKNGEKVGYSLIVQHIAPGASGRLKLNSMQIATLRTTVDNIADSKDDPKPTVYIHEPPSVDGRVALAIAQARSHLPPSADPIAAAQWLRNIRPNSLPHLELIEDAQLLASQMRFANGSLAQEIKDLGVKTEKQIQLSRAICEACSIEQLHAKRNHDDVKADTPEEQAKLRAELYAKRRTEALKKLVALHNEEHWQQDLASLNMHMAELNRLQAGTLEAKDFDDQNKPLVQLLTNTRAVTHQYRDQYYAVIKQFDSLRREMLLATPVESFKIHKTPDGLGNNAVPNALEQQVQAIAYVGSQTIRNIELTFLARLRDLTCARIMMDGNPFQIDPARGLFDALFNPQILLDEKPINLPQQNYLNALAAFYAKHQGSTDAETQLILSAYQTVLKIQELNKVKSDLPQLLNNKLTIPAETKTELLAQIVKLPSPPVTLEVRVKLTKFFQTEGLSVTEVVAELTKLKVPAALHELFTNVFKQQNQKVEAVNRKFAELVGKLIGLADILKIAAPDQHALAVIEFDKTFVKTIQQNVDFEDEVQHYQRMGIKVLPKINKNGIAEAFHHLNSNYAADTLEIALAQLKDESKIQESLQELSAELADNYYQLFGKKERGFIKTVTLDKTKRSDAKRNTLIKLTKETRIQEANVFVAECGSYTPEQFKALLAKRSSLIKKVIRFIEKNKIFDSKNDRHKKALKFIKEDLESVNCLRDSLHAAVSMPDLIKSKVLNLSNIFSKLTVQTLPLISNGQTIVENIQTILLRMKELEVLLAHANSSAALDSLQAKFAELSALFKNDEIDTINATIASAESNLNALVLLDPNNPAIQKYRQLFSEITVASGAKNQYPKSWKEAVILARTWQQYQTTYEQLDKHRDKLIKQQKEQRGINLTAKSTVVVEVPINSFVLQDIALTWDAYKEVLQTSVRELEKEVKSPAERLQCAKAINILLSTNNILKGIKRKYTDATVSVNYETKDENIALPAALQKIHALCLFLDAKKKELAIDLNILKTDPNKINTLATKRASVMECDTELKTATQYQLTFQKTRAELDRVLSTLEALRYKQKKLYLKESLSHPVFFELIDKYPDLLSNDPDQLETQVKILQKAFQLGLTGAALRKELTDAGLKIVEDDIVRIERFNSQLSFIYTTGLESVVEISAFLHTKGLDVTDAALQAFCSNIAEQKQAWFKHNIEQIASEIETLIQSFDAIRTPASLTEIEQQNQRFITWQTLLEDRQSQYAKLQNLIVRDEFENGDVELMNAAFVNAFDKLNEARKRYDTTAASLIYGKTNQFHQVKTVLQTLPERVSALKAEIAKLRHANKVGILDHVDAIYQFTHDYQVFDDLFQATQTAATEIEIQNHVQSFAKLIASITEKRQRLVDLREFIAPDQWLKADGFLSELERSLRMLADAYAHVLADIRSNKDLSSVIEAGILAESTRGTLQKRLSARLLTEIEKVAKPLATANAILIELHTKSRTFISELTQLEEGMVAQVATYKQAPRRINQEATLIARDFDFLRNIRSDIATYQVTNWQQYETLPAVRYAITVHLGEDMNGFNLAAMDQQLTQLQVEVNDSLAAYSKSSTLAAYHQDLKTRITSDRSSNAQEKYQQFLHVIDSNLTAGQYTSAAALFDELLSSNWGQDLLEFAKQGNVKLYQSVQALNSKIIDFYARDLVAMSRNLFLQIPDGEWLQPSSYTNATICPNMVRYAKYYNNLIVLVTRAILEKSDINQHTSAVERWIHIAYQCYQQKDFTSAKAVLDAILSTPIYRLIEKDGKQDQILANGLTADAKKYLNLLKEVFKTAKNSRNLREAIQASEIFIPLMPQLRQDITFTKDGNAKRDLLLLDGAQNVLAVLDKARTALTACPQTRLPSDFLVREIAQQRMVDEDFNTEMLNLSKQLYPVNTQQLPSALLTHFSDLRVANIFSKILNKNVQNILLHLYGYRSERQIPAAVLSKIHDVTNGIFNSENISGRLNELKTAFREADLPLPESIYTQVYEVVDRQFLQKQMQIALEVIDNIEQTLAAAKEMKGQNADLIQVKTILTQAKDSLQPGALMSAIGRAQYDISFSLQNIAGHLKTKGRNFEQLLLEQNKLLDVQTNDLTHTVSLQRLDAIESELLAQERHLNDYRPFWELTHAIGKQALRLTGFYSDPANIKFYRADDLFARIKNLRSHITSERASIERKYRDLLTELLVAQNEVFPNFVPPQDSIAQLPLLDRVTRYHQLEIKNNETLLATKLDHYQNLSASIGEAIISFAGDASKIQALEQSKLEIENKIQALRQSQVNLNALRKLLLQDGDVEIEADLAALTAIIASVSPASIADLSAKLAADDIIAHTADQQRLQVMAFKTIIYNIESAYQRKHILQDKPKYLATLTALETYYQTVPASNEQLKLIKELSQQLTSYNEKQITTTIEDLVAKFDFRKETDRLQALVARYSDLQTRIEQAQTDYMTMYVFLTEWNSLQEAVKDVPKLFKPYLQYSIAGNDEFVSWLQLVHQLVAKFEQMQNDPVAIQTLKSAAVQQQSLLTKITAIDQIRDQVSTIPVIPEDNDGSQSEQEYVDEQLLQLNANAARLQHYKDSLNSELSFFTAKYGKSFTNLVADYQALLQRLAQTQHEEQELNNQIVALKDKDDQAALDLTVTLKEQHKHLIKVLETLEKRKHSVFGLFTGIDVNDLTRLATLYTEVLAEIDDNEIQLSLNQKQFAERSAHLKQAEKDEAALLPQLVVEIWSVFATLEDNKKQYSLELSAFKFNQQDGLIQKILPENLASKLVITATEAALQGAETKLEQGRIKLKELSQNLDKLRQHPQFKEYLVSQVARFDANSDLFNNECMLLIEMYGDYQRDLSGYELEFAAVEQYVQSCKTILPFASKAQTLQEAFATASQTYAADNDSNRYIATLMELQQQADTLNSNVATDILPQLALKNIPNADHIIAFCNNFANLKQQIQTEQAKIQHQTLTERYIKEGDRLYPVRKNISENIIEYTRIFEEEIFPQLTNITNFTFEQYIELRDIYLGCVAERDRVKKISAEVTAFLDQNPVLQPDQLNEDEPLYIYHGLLSTWKQTLASDEGSFDLTIQLLAPLFAVIKGTQFYQQQYVDYEQLQQLRSQIHKWDRSQFEAQPELTKTLLKTSLATITELEQKYQTRLAEFSKYDLKESDHNPLLKVHRQLIKHHTEMVEYLAASKAEATLLLSLMNDQEAADKVVVNQMIINVQPRPADRSVAEHNAGEVRRLDALQKANAEIEQRYKDRIKKLVDASNELDNNPYSRIHSALLSRYSNTVSTLEKDKPEIAHSLLQVNLDEILYRKGIADEAQLMADLTTALDAELRVFHKKSTELSVDEEVLSKFEVKGESLVVSLLKNVANSQNPTADIAALQAQLQVVDEKYTDLTAEASRVKDAHVLPQRPDLSLASYTKASYVENTQLYNKQINSIRDALSEDIDRIEQQQPIVQQHIALMELFAKIASVTSLHSAIKQQFGWDQHAFAAIDKNSATYQEQLKDHQLKIQALLQRCDELGTQVFAITSDRARFAQLGLEEADILAITRYCNNLNQLKSEVTRHSEALTHQSKVSDIPAAIALYKEIQATIVADFDSAIALATKQNYLLWETIVELRAANDPMSFYQQCLVNKGMYLQPYATILKKLAANLDAERITNSKLTTMLGNIAFDNPNLAAIQAEVTALREATAQAKTLFIQDQIRYKTLPLVQAADGVTNENTYLRDAILAFGRNLPEDIIPQLVLKLKANISRGDFNKFLKQYGVTFTENVFNIVRAASLAKVLEEEKAQIQPFTSFDAFKMELEAANGELEAFNQLNSDPNALLMRQYKASIFKKKQAKADLDSSHFTNAAKILVQRRANLAHLKTRFAQFSAITKANLPQQAILVTLQCSAQNSHALAELETTYKKQLLEYERSALRANRNVVSWLTYLEKQFTTEYAAVAALNLDCDAALQGNKVKPNLSKKVNTRLEQLKNLLGLVYIDVEADQLVVDDASSPLQQLKATLESLDNQRGARLSSLVASTVSAYRTLQQHKTTIDTQLVAVAQPREQKRQPVDQNHSSPFVRSRQESLAQNPSVVADQRLQSPEILVLAPSVVRQEDRLQSVLIQRDSSGREQKSQILQRPELERSASIASDFSWDEHERRDSRQASVSDEISQRRDSLAESPRQRQASELDLGLSLSRSASKRVNVTSQELPAAVVADPSFGRTTTTAKVKEVTVQFTDNHSVIKTRYEIAGGLHVFNPEASYQEMRPSTCTAAQDKEKLHIAHNKTLADMVGDHLKQEQQVQRQEKSSKVDLAASLTGPEELCKKTAKYLWRADPSKVIYINGKIYKGWGDVERIGQLFRGLSFSRKQPEKTPAEMKGIADQVLRNVL